jgi:hypothetical protein
MRFNVPDIDTVGGRGGNLKNFIPPPFELRPAQLRPSFVPALTRDDWRTLETERLHLGNRHRDEGIGRRYPDGDIISEAIRTSVRIGLCAIAHTFGLVVGHDG